jgi:hypothetical protein
MASQNFDYVRRVFDAFPATQERLRMGTLPIGFGLAEDVEWDASEIGLPDLGDGVLHGYEGVRRFWMVWLSAWKDVRFDYEIREAGDKVVVLIDQKNDTSDLSIPLVYAQIWTFEEGLVVHWKSYRDPQEALRVAGLEGGG